MTVKLTGSLWNPTVLLSDVPPQLQLIYEIRVKGCPNKNLWIILGTRYRFSCRSVPVGILFEQVCVSNWSIKCALKSSNASLCLIFCRSEINERVEEMESQLRRESADHQVREMSRWEWWRASWGERVLTTRWEKWAGGRDGETVEERAITTR